MKGGGGQVGRRERRRKKMNDLVKHLTFCPREN